jgi:hypothetical protein
MGLHGAFHWVTRKRMKRMEGIELSQQALGKLPLYPCALRLLT